MPGRRAQPPRRALHELLFDVKSDYAVCYCNAYADYEGPHVVKASTLAAHKTICKRDTSKDFYSFKHLRGSPIRSIILMLT